MYKRNVSYFCRDCENLTEGIPCEHCRSIDVMAVYSLCCVCENYNKLCAFCENSVHFRIKKKKKTEKK